MTTTFAPETVILKAGTKFSVEVEGSMSEKVTLDSDAEVTFVAADANYSIYRFVQGDGSEGEMVFVAAGDEA